MSDSDQSVQLSFRHTEPEYLAAVCYYIRHSKELLLRLVIFYVLVSTGIHLLSIIPKRAFTDDGQETTFRQLLRRHIDHNLKLSAVEREKREYLPPAQPPDWH